MTAREEPVMVTTSSCKHPAFSAWQGYLPNARTFIHTHTSRDKAEDTSLSPRVLRRRYAVKDAQTGAHVYATPDTEVFHMTLILSHHDDQVRGRST